MSNPHNKNRYGELWPQHKIDAALEELRPIKPFVVLSGGWAWHFMSEPGHPEFKHAHDHKDIDLFVIPEHVGVVVSMLKAQNFNKVWTRYDSLESEEDFRRYEKLQHIDGHAAFRITMDFFVKTVPQREVKGWLVTEPEFLLSLYGNIHSSDKCFAVQAASKLLQQGIDPENRPELVAIPN